MDGAGQRRVGPCLFQASTFIRRTSSAPKRRTLFHQPLSGNNIHEGTAGGPESHTVRRSELQGPPGSLRTRADNKPSCGVNGCQCLSRVSNLWWGSTAMIDSVPHASSRVKRRLADSCCTAPQGSGGAARTGCHEPQSHPN